MTDITLKGWYAIRDKCLGTKTIFPGYDSIAKDITEYGDKVIDGEVTYMWARDEEEAIKIASERFAQYDALPTCWAIVSGEYSSYEVHAIFSTKEQAIEQMDLWGGDEVQEFPFNDFLPKPPKGMKAWAVLKDPNKKALVCFSSTAQEIKKYGDKVEDDNFIWSYRTYLWARDKEHAIKIASERFAKYKAQQSGIA